MRSNKRFTNATFTKRVDHDAGRHRAKRAAKEPTVCALCGAVYFKRRWISADHTHLADNKHFRPLIVTTCPACIQMQGSTPSGYLFVEGSFFKLHRDDIERLLRNEAERAVEDNPLARIMLWREDVKLRLTVSTTTEHLAIRLGHALEKAFSGELRYDFSHENKLARVYWRRN